MSCYTNSQPPQAGYVLLPFPDSPSSLFILRMAPGLGYGLIWKRGPEAVTSTPVLASPCLSSPVDHFPLGVGREEEEAEDVK